MATRSKTSAPTKPHMEYRVAYRFLGSEEQAQRARRRVIDCLRASVVSRRREATMEPKVSDTVEDSQ